jgi:hypothetical protein
MDFDGGNGPKALKYIYRTYPTRHYFKKEDEASCRAEIKVKVPIYSIVCVTNTMSENHYRESGVDLGFLITNDILSMMLHTQSPDDNTECKQWEKDDKAC